MTEVRRLSVDVDGFVSGRHPALPADDRTALSAFMRAGHVLTAARSLSEDRLDPTHPRCVPLIIKTDGQWVWTAASEYYLEKYGVVPCAAFIAHARTADFEVPQVDDARLAVILVAIGTPDQGPLSQ